AVAQGALEASELRFGHAMAHRGVSPGAQSVGNVQQLLAGLVGREPADLRQLAQPVGRGFQVVRSSDGGLPELLLGGGVDVESGAQHPSAATTQEAVVAQVVIGVVVADVEGGSQEQLAQVFAGARTSSSASVMP